MKDFFDFIDNRPTCFHAVENVKVALLAAGAMELQETIPFHLESGKTYFVTRNGSSLLAFHLPKWEQGKRPSGYRIYAAHSDSPCFKIKPCGVMKAEGEYVMLNTEKYGGMILSTWLDRPLSLAGRIVYEQEGMLVTKTVNLDELTCIIPNVAIHMNRDMNKGVEYNPQTDMRPLIGLSKDMPELRKLIADKAGIQQDSILGEDLYVYSKEKCCLMGTSEELLGGPRLDDLECVYAGLQGFLSALGTGDNARDKAALTDCITTEGGYNTAGENDSEDEHTTVEKMTIPMLAIFDNEEVGSGTKQGADSTFLTDILERIAHAMHWDSETIKCMYADSFMISADNAHAVHPNHPEKADPTNRPIINGGIVVKYHGGQKYTTDAYSEAVLKRYAKKAQVSLQTYANKSDIPGGSTLGNISTAHLSIPTVDIGLPQLAMHSAFETAGVEDYRDLCKLTEAYFG